jgi:hypothetical protein
MTPGQRRRRRIDPDERLAAALLLEDLDAQLDTIVADEDAVRTRDQPTIPLRLLPRAERADEVGRVRPERALRARGRPRTSHVRRLHRVRVARGNGRQTHVVNSRTSMRSRNVDQLARSVRILDASADAEACDGIVRGLPAWFGDEDGLRERVQLVRSSPGWSASKMRRSSGS